MQKQKVRLVGDPALSQKARPISGLDLPSLVHIIPMMYEVMCDEKGIGLAANQVGLDLAVFVLGIGGFQEAFINPEIISTSDLVDFEEGCLSIPGVVAKTKRFNKLTLRWASSLDDISALREETFEGIKAIAIQHEMDHLNGKLFISQFGPVKRAMVLDKHRKYIKLTRS